MLPFGQASPLERPGGVRADGKPRPGPPRLGCWPLAGPSGGRLAPREELSGLRRRIGGGPEKVSRGQSAAGRVDAAALPRPVRRPTLLRGHDRAIATHRPRGEDRGDVQLSGMP